MCYDEAIGLAGDLEDNIFDTAMRWQSKTRY
jgi:hypothetical protein